MRTKNSQACMLRTQGGTSKDRGAVLSQAPALSRCWPEPAVVALVGSKGEHSWGNSCCHQGATLV